MRARLGVLALLGALTAFAATARAQDMGALFERGAQAWVSGDRATALQAWETLREAGVRDPDLEYDLGTAYAESGQLGRAVWHFETALRLRPSDEDAQASLEAAQTGIGRRLAQVEGAATVRTRPPMAEAVVAPFSEAGLAYAALVLNALLFALLAWRRFAQREALRVTLAVAAPLVALLLLASLWGVGVKRGLFEDGRAGVVLDDTPLNEGPDPRAAERGQAREGERARVIASEGGYVHLRLGGEREGWVEATHVGDL